MKKNTRPAARFLGAALLAGVFANAASGALPGTIGDEDDRRALLRGEVVLLEDRGENSQEESAKWFVTAGIVIEAPAEAVWEVVTDKEAAPEYVKDLKRATILESGEGFQLVEQEMKISIFLPVFTYTIRHRLRPPKRIDFKKESGDLRDIEGSWEFVPVDGGEKTLLIYRLRIDPGMMIPALVVRKSLRKSLPAALTGVRERVYRSAVARSVD